ncbi:dysbindin domain-containing protein 1 isoform X2 [Gouania willdenowi]|uniref:Dysbindin domain-containing protein 1 n=1 Tax=Gouania willdenowi TaxID=441366 RepID=A0A8C5DRP1_GOUWI|nr:dysbindin domain-containing protein 1 isoform X2 [Gouania willdenowi]
MPESTFILSTSAYYFSEPNKDIQKLLKPSSSGDLSKEPFQLSSRDQDCSLSGHNVSLLNITEKRQPLSSVSSLEVHFDLLDLTELTDMSDQELAEVFADSDEENHNESPAGSHPPVLPKGGYMRSPSWTRCSRADPPRERKHHSDSDIAEPMMKLDRPKQP